MIRIDEIYDSVFWAYAEKLANPVRMFYLSPFGSTGPENLKCFQHSQNNEQKYIVLFDQEPINFERHDVTFQEIQRRCQNLYPRWPLRFPSSLNTNPLLVTSEKYNPDFMKLCVKYGYDHAHYFFHGWAALDWFRGYNRTFLMPAPQQRQITKTFIMPNRIIGGERTHRVKIMYHLIKADLLNNHISFPKICPVEQLDIQDVIQPLTVDIPDIVSTFKSINLPINFDNETGHPMHSYKLSLFSECSQALLYLVSETVATGDRIYLTEKTFKPICLQMPFVLVAGAGSLEYLRGYGFKTFGDYWDESYDLELDDNTRFKKIAKLLSTIDKYTIKEKQNLYREMYPILQHNYQHFYNGHFEQVLWNELQTVLYEF